MALMLILFENFMKFQCLWFALLCCQHCAKHLVYTFKRTPNVISELVAAMGCSCTITDCFKTEQNSLLPDAQQKSDIADVCHVSIVTHFDTGSGDEMMVVRSVVA